MTRNSPTISRTAQVLEMLAKPKGASLEAICKATGWQPHSARAALSRLRKAGHSVERQPGGGRSRTFVYRSISSAEVAE